MKNLFTQRKLLRLKKFDYSTPGYYFVTICTKRRIPFFGEIINRNIILNEIGNIVKQQWLWLEKNFKYVKLDEWIIMPNHLHGIVIINNYVGNGRDRSLPTKIKPLPELIGAFKTTSSKLIRQLGLNSFQWQKSYYDHIIRNENSLQKIRQYIRYNHLKWKTDIENPKNYLKTNDYYEKLFS